MPTQRFEAKKIEFNWPTTIRFRNDYWDVWIGKVLDGDEKETHKDVEVLLFKTYAAWLKWLAANHDRVDAIWIKFAKKSSGYTSITYEEAREGAIIYGWIDGLINGLNDYFFLRRFTPRRPRSKWSLINRNIATELIQSKKMKPPGLAEVNAAKKDGRWDAAYPPPSKMEVPDDLKKRLNQNSKAKKFFESISAANRYAFLHRIQDAKRAATREKRIEQTMDMLKNGEVFHPNR